ncbi:MAG: VWA-like domain-containing protein [Candidatus Heimdallarchaeota archaeon]|nr:VWA-like domain-containing protein [Candidatus Heimdallarchaeota archaeon]
MKKDAHTTSFLEAVTKLTMTDIFFTALFYSLTHKQDNEISVAATNGVCIKYNPVSFAEYSLKDRTFILCHEILHIVLQHSLRRGGRNHKIWNIACDYAVNSLLVAAKKYKPKDALYKEEYNGMSAEKIYDVLIKNKGNDETKFNELTMPDVLDYDPAENAGHSAAEVSKNMELLLAKAVANAEAGGYSDGMLRAIQDISVQEIPWYTILHKHMQSLNKNEFNWARINYKRSQTFGLLTPQLLNEGLGNIVIAVDCSGSISNAQLASIAKHLKSLCTHCVPEKVTILYFTTEVNKTQVFNKPYTNLVLSPGVSGGTNFTDVINTVNKKYHDASLLIIMTDLFASCEAYTNIPTLWVTDHPENPVAFGEKITADFND